MFLYFSNATEPSVYDELFQAGRVFPAYQMQKFNSNIIAGLARLAPVTALSTLPYRAVSMPRREITSGGVHYVAVRNHKGRLHKLGNLFHLFWEGCRLIRKERPKCILCDAIATSPCYISALLGKLFKIPSVGIVTDLPGMLIQKRDALAGIGRMRQFDAYVLLTGQMEPLVNPEKKPSMILEGLCTPVLPPLADTKASPRTILYTGSLWKKDAGIEYFTQGFLQADLPDCQLHFYGVGEAVPWLEALSKTHPQVQYKGSVTNREIMELQARATLLVNPRPSDEEFCKYSFPSKTIEYMASGTPVLMTRLPGVGQEYFDYVYTIDEETPEGACRALKEIFAQEDRDLQKKGLAAREYVRTQKSCNAQTERLYRFCEKLIKVRQ